LVVFVTKKRASVGRFFLPTKTTQKLQKEFHYLPAAGMAFRAKKALS